LRRAAPYFRAQLAQAIKLRFAPTIGFEADTSFEYANRIDALLQDPVVQRDLTAPRQDAEPDADDAVPAAIRAPDTSDGA